MRGAASIVICMLAGCDHLFVLPHIDPPPFDAITGDGDAVVLPGSITGVDLGGSHTCAIANGAVRCWGLGNIGQLGYGNTDSIGDNEEPRAAGDVNVGAGVLAVSAGYQHTCAITVDRDMYCWGYGGVGQLGYANVVSIGDTETPAAIGNVSVGDKVDAIAAGDSHTCALLPGGAVRCWGSGANGRLGYGNTINIGDNEFPSGLATVDIGLEVAQLVAGGDHTCVLGTSKAVRCWGAGSVGQTGYGSANDIGDNEPPSAAGDVTVGGSVTRIAAGQLHTCALLDTGAVRCWGLGAYGALGYGNTSAIGDTEGAATGGDVNVGGVVIDLAAGGDHTCAVLSNNELVCWGHNNYGQLGYGHTLSIGDDELPSSAGPVPVGGPVARVWAGRDHTCALLTSGALRCWGRGMSGRLGYSNVDDIGDDEAPSAAGDVPAF